MKCPVGHLSLADQPAELARSQMTGKRDLEKEKEKRLLGNRNRRSPPVGIDSNQDAHKVKKKKGTFFIHFGEEEVWECDKIRRSRSWTEIEWEKAVAWPFSGGEWRRNSLCLYLSTFRRTTFRNITNKEIFRMKLSFLQKSFRTVLFTKKNLAIFTYLFYC